MIDQPQPPAEPPIVALDPGLVFERREVGGRTTYVALQHQTGKYFHFGAQEYHAATLLDGRRSIAEVAAQLQSDGVDWTGQEVVEFVGKLVASNLATTSGPQSAALRTNSPSWSHRVPAYLSLLISQRIPLLNGHDLASFLEQRIGIVFSKLGIVYWIGLITSGLLIVAGHHREFISELRRMFDPGVWVLLLLMWIVAKVIHELGHAVAARHHGVRVGKMGIIFFLCAPLAYVDVTDAWKLRSRWSRIQIALAGVYLELAIAAIAAWIWWWLPAGYARHLAAQMVLVAGPATLLVNANPLLRLDGYYVLSDLCEIPNLRMHGRSQLSGIVNFVLLGNKPKDSLLTGWRRPFATAHAAASVVFQIIWMTGLVVGISLWRADSACCWQPRQFYYGPCFLCCAGRAQPGLASRVASCI